MDEDINVSNAIGWLAMRKEQKRQLACQLSVVQSLLQEKSEMSISKEEAYRWLVTHVICKAGRGRVCTV